MILNHIDHRAKRADVTSFQLFNEMLKRMETRDFTPMDEDIDLDTKDIQEVIENSPSKATQATPSKPYVTPVNETSRTPINLASSEDTDEQHNSDVKSTTEVLITQEDHEAMEAVIQQSKEEAEMTIDFQRTKQPRQADIKSKVQQSSVKLTRLRSKTRQNQNTSTEYQTRSRSNNRSKGSGLGREE